MAPSYGQPVRAVDPGALGLPKPGPINPLLQRMTSPNTPWEGINPGGPMRPAFPGAEFNPGGPIQGLHPTIVHLLRVLGIGHGGPPGFHPSPFQPSPQRSPNPFHGVGIGPGPTHIDQGYNPAGFELATGHPEQAVADWEAHHPAAMAQHQFPAWVTRILARRMNAARNQGHAGAPSGPPPTAL